MTYLSIATILLSIFVMAESFGALIKLPPGILPQFCCKVKYVAASAASSAYIWYAATSDDAAVQWVVFISAATLAWFVWPRTVWRVKEYLRELDEWETS
jgi:hypothetical protein